MRGITLDPNKLAADAAARGLSLTALARLARISKNTVAKINRGEQVRPSIARRFDETLDGLAALEHVQEVAS